MEGHTSEIDHKFRLPDAIWEHTKTLLPVAPPKPKGGRPRNDDRHMMDAIFYVLRTGIQWKALPRSVGASSSVHDRLQQWQQAGVFRAMWVAGVLAYDRATGIEWTWQALDGAMTKAPLGGSATGPNPTDRAKSGTKRCLLTEGKGVPMAVTVAGANRHDMKMAAATLDATVVERPEPTPDTPQHVSMDKGFDYDEIRDAVAARHYIAHILARGEETALQHGTPGHRARRWVVERTHSWMNRFRRVLIRWEKKVENYMAMLELACAYISFRTAGVFG